MYKRSLFRRHLPLLTSGDGGYLPRAVHGPLYLARIPCGSDPRIPACAVKAALDSSAVGFQLL